MKIQCISIGIIWWELPQVTEEVSDQKHVVLLKSEQEQIKGVIDAKKGEIKTMEIYGVYESHNLKTDSSTCCREAMRIVMLIASVIK